MSLPEDRAGARKNHSLAELLRLHRDFEDAGYSLHDDPLGVAAPVAAPPAPAPAPRAARSTAGSLAVAGRPEGDRGELVAVGNTVALPRREDRPQGAVLRDGDKERAARDKPRPYWMLAQVARHELTRAERLLFEGYGSFARDGGVAMVSLARVAWESYLARSTAETARKGLVRKGWLVRVGGGGRTQVGRYDTAPGWRRVRELWEQRDSARRLSLAARRGRREPPQPGLPTPLPVR